MYSPFTMGDGVRRLWRIIEDIEKHLQRTDSLLNKDPRYAGSMQGREGLQRDGGERGILPWNRTCGSGRSPCSKLESARIF
jgi:hypothetical protein